MFVLCYRGASSTQLSPATGVPRHPLSHQSHPHPFPPPIFAPPVASAPSAAVTSNAPPQQSNPHPFSAESLFQSSMSLQHGDLYKGIFLFCLFHFCFFKQPFLSLIHSFTLIRFIALNGLLFLDTYLYLTYLFNGWFGGFN